MIGMLLHESVVRNNGSPHTPLGPSGLLATRGKIHICTDNGQKRSQQKPGIRKDNGPDKAGSLTYIRGRDGAREPTGSCVGVPRTRAQARPRLARLRRGGGEGGGGKFSGPPEWSYTEISLGSVHPSIAMHLYRRKCNPTSSWSMDAGALRECYLQSIIIG
jgi:hypothetical protein